MERGRNRTREKNVKGGRDGRDGRIEVERRSEGRRGWEEREE